MAAFILAWPGAIAIGMSLGLLGSGGSILTVPVLVYLVGQDEKLAIASSLAIVGLISLVGSLPYLRNKLIDWRSVWLFGVPGMMGTYLGAWSSVWVSGTVQLAVFAVVMLAASAFMLKPAATTTTRVTLRSPTKIGIDGLLVGALTGFVGVGGGFLVVPALVLLGGLSMHRAVATSLVIIALKSLTGFVKYLDVLEHSHIKLDIDIILLITALGIIGSFAGNRLATRMPQERLRKLFAVFLVLMGTFILYQSVPTLFASYTT